MANKPDIIKTKEKTRILIDVAIPADRNVIKKESEKRWKYRSLCTAIQRMWNTKCVIIPVITAAIGTVTKGVKKNLKTFNSFTTKERQQYLEHHT
jgi:hypothetical protein